MMNKKLDMVLRILGIGMIVVLIKFSIDIILKLDAQTIVFYAIGAAAVVILFLAIKKMADIWENSKKQQHRQKLYQFKAGQYEQFIKTVHLFLEKKENSQEELNLEIKRLYLYASSEVIRAAEQLRQLKTTDSEPILKLIRKDLLSGEIETLGE